MKRHTLAAILSISMLVAGVTARQRGKRPRHRRRWAIGPWRVSPPAPGDWSPSGSRRTAPHGRAPTD
jgi:hypothetical protein